MAIIPRSFSQGRQYALLAITTIACFGCTSIGSPGFSRTPLDPASRTYPTVASGCACTVTPIAARWFERVLLIVLENQDYKDAINNQYLRELAKQGANFTNFHGLFHPSYSNYLAMVAGKEILTYFDRQKDLNECTVADLLQSKGITWKNYAQGYPSQIDTNVYPDRCVKDHSIGKYARKHVPFMSFIPIQNAQCGNIVSASQFDDDLKNDALPHYAFYTPDLDNDGHDGGVVNKAKGLDDAAQWLERFLEPLLKNQHVMKGTLIVVTFDESHDQTQDAGNHIYTVFLGDMVEPTPIPDHYNHYNVLRTIEENFGLCSLEDGDSGAKPITGVWRKGTH